MDTIEISMVGITQETVNPSLQIGDNIWCADVYSLGGNNLTNSSNTVRIGRASKIEFFPDEETMKLTVFIETNVAYTPSLGDFIFFTKSREVNAVAPIGYYARVVMSNGSSGKIELFSVGCTIHESSK